MALTNYIRIPQIKQKFKEQFPVPKIKLDAPILASPNTRNYTLVGTAFDYLLRFYIKQGSPESIEQQWLAEGSVGRIKLNSGQYVLVDGDLEPFDNNKDAKEQFPDAKSIHVSEPSKEWAKAIKPSEKIVSDARKRYSEFIKTGKLEDDLIKSTLKLAQLDLVRRAGILEICKGISNQDVKDLRNLINVATNSKIFKTNQKTFLNPTFGKGSDLVGGADADLVIEDTLIDIKVTKNIRFTQEMYNQIIGYYALSTIGDEPTKIKNIGIYFARHGIMHTIPVKKVGQKSDFDNVVMWFEKITEKIKEIQLSKLQIQEVNFSD